MIATISARVAATCRDFFGAYRAGRWLPANRCDSCPLRAPCLARGAAPAHTLEQLAESRETFARKAEAVLEQTTGAS